MESRDCGPRSHLCRSKLLRFDHALHVLIITNDHDEHASAVIRELHKRDVPVFRFHPEDLPHACSVSIEIRDGRIDGEIRNAHHRVALNDVCAAWFRRARNLFADPRA